MQDCDSIYFHYLNFVLSLKTTESSSVDNNTMMFSSSAVDEAVSSVLSARKNRVIVNEKGMVWENKEGVEGVLLYTQAQTLADIVLFGLFFSSFPSKF